MRTAVPRESARHGRVASARVSARDSALRAAARLQLGEARVDLGELAEVVELVELRVEARGGQFRLTANDGLFTADLVFEAADLARRVEDVDRLHGVLHLALRIGRLRACDEFGALVLELDQLLLHAVEARLQLVDDLGLRGDLRLGGLRLVLGRDLAAEGDLREVVELVGVRRVTACTELIALAARREGLLAPLARGFDVFAVIVFEQAQVADGLGDRGFGVGDRVREVAHDLVQHQLGVFGLVDEAVDVGSQQLRDPSEDGLLCHGRSFRGDRRSSESVEMWMRGGTFTDRYGRLVDRYRSRAPARQVRQNRPPLPRRERVPEPPKLPGERPPPPKPPLLPPPPPNPPKPPPPPPPPRTELIRMPPSTAPPRSPPPPPLGIPPPNMPPLPKPLTSCWASDMAWPASCSARWAAARAWGGSDTAVASASTTSRPASARRVRASAPIAPRRATR